MKGRASRIPGCQRILLRLRRIRIALDRAATAREQSPRQQAWLREAADALDRVLASGATLGGAGEVRQHRARIARKRTRSVRAEDGWSIGLYEN